MNHPKASHMPLSDMARCIWLGSFGFFLWNAFIPSVARWDLSQWPFLAISSLLGIGLAWHFSKQSNHKSQLIWGLGAGTLTVLVVQAAWGGWVHPALFWITHPLLAFTIGQSLYTSHALSGRHLYVRLSNSFLISFTTLFLCIFTHHFFLSSLFQWVATGLLLAGFAGGFLSNVSPNVNHVTPEKLTPKDVLSLFPGPLLLSLWLVFVLTHYLEQAYFTFGHRSLFWWLLSLAALGGMGFSHRGMSRFGPYRHLCQAALLAALFAIAAQLRQSFWSFLLVGILICYLSGSMIVALVGLHMDSHRHNKALSRAIGLSTLVLGGTLIGLILPSPTTLVAMFWTIGLLVITALLFLQHYMRHLQSVPHSDEFYTNWIVPKTVVFGEGQHTIISRSMRRCSRILAEIFFAQIKIEGAHHLAQEKRAILVANHPNTFLDPLLITAISPGRLHYWAKSTLWRLPILGSILDRMGAIPVFRRQDVAKGTTSGDNQLSIALAARKLNAGGWLLIFPEGGSHSGLSIKPLKTGTARVAFRALQESNWQEEISIVPVGIDYLEPSIFRSDVCIRISEPIPISSYREAFDKNNKEAVLSVTDDVSTALKDALPHLENPELEALVHQIADLYGERLEGIMGESNPAMARKAISEAVNHYQQLDPDTLLLFSQRMAAYDQEKSRLSTPENHAPIPLKALFRIFTSMFSFVTYGIISNWLPYKLVRRVITILDPNPVWLGTAKLAWGTLIFGIYYFVCGAICYRMFGGLFAFLLIASFIISAFIAMGALDRFAFRINQLKLVWQAFWTQDTNDDLEEMKLSLISDLERFREAYAFYRTQTIPTTSGGNS